jgi:MoxR-like ATPase
VFLHPTVAAYLLDLVDLVRHDVRSRQPLSPRASLALAQLARAHAHSAGRDHVRPDDVQAVAIAGLAHRIVDATNDDLIAAREAMATFLRRVPVPPAPGG